MARDLQISSDELSALVDLAWRAPKLQAEVLWLRCLSERIAALADANIQEIQLADILA